jgi:hypothetical protein
MSAVLFVISRDTERAAAAAPTSAAVEPAAISKEDVLVTNLPSGDTLIVTPPAAPTPTVAEPATPTTEAAQPAASVDKPKKHTTTKKLQVKPRLDQPLDPDGTLDPYR